MPQMYAEVLLSKKIGQDKDTLTYRIPKDLSIQAGNLVKVNLRKKETYGIVIDIHKKPPNFKTLDILGNPFTKPLLNKTQLEIIQWMKEQYFCASSKLLTLFLPLKIRNNKSSKAEVRSEQEQIYSSRIEKLNKEQRNCVKSIISSRKNKFLIHGITGSGKTEVYCYLSKHLIEKGEQVLILVPEISLTPQTIEYFEKNLGVKAVVLNSKITETKKQINWHKIWLNEAKLVIGSRSSIFAPFQSLKLIIIDEEHDGSYKQDNSPRYHTHEIAEKMQELSPELKIVYGSATPSIETKEKLKDTTLSLTKRIGQSTLPKIEIVDLKDEFKKGNYSIFSDSLKESISEALAKKEQVILFLNRRGNASSVVCRDCGYVQKCPNCETAMTHHSKTFKTESLICHHCGKIAKSPNTCENCKGPNIRFLGIGTQKIEQETLKEFPHAKVLRADKDSTSKKDGFKKIYDTFKTGQADILIGTQMIAKGLHLPKVNLVGVVLADISLNIPDYKTTERNFQLMMQVAGRAGRSGTEGKVIIQTYSPDSIALVCTKKHDYEEFFKYERTQRKLLNNPPFSQIAKIVVQNKSYQKCLEEVEKIYVHLTKHAKNEMEINHYPAYLSKLRGKHRHIIFLKDKTNQNQIHNLIAKLPKEYIINPDIKIDINPLSTT